MRPSTDAYKKYMGYNGVPGQQRSSATVSTAPSGLWSAAGRSNFAFDDAFKELTGSSPVKSKTSDDKPVVSDMYARSAAYQAPASSAGSTPKLSTSAQAGAQFPSTAQNTSALPSAAAAVLPPGIKKTSGLWSASGRPGIAKQGASHGTGGGNADASAGTSKPAPPPTISKSAAGAAAAPGHVVHKSSDTASSASQAAKSAQAVKASSGTTVETTKVSKPTSVASAPEQPRHWSVPVPGPAPPAWPPQQRSVAEAKKSGEGLQAATTSSALTVEGVAKRLLPFLGPGLAPLMLQVSPPPVLRDPAAGYYPQSLRRKLEAGSSAGGASGRTSPAMGVKISAPFDGKKGAVVSHHAEPMVDEFGREIDQMPLMATNASSRHHHHMNIDQSRDFDSRKGIGGFVKVQDSVFVDALLQIPLRSIATPETLRILVARGTSAYEPLVAPAAPEPVQQQRMQMQEQVVVVQDAFGNFHYQTIHAPVPVSDPAYHHHHQQQHGGARKPGSGRLQEPPGCPYSLLPHLPRPGFNDYFGHSNSSGSSSKSQVNEGTGAVYGSSASSSSEAVASTTTLAIGSGRPGVAWPQSWAQYHATFACLLLEEARAALAGTAMEAARQRVRGAVASARQSTGADSAALGGADGDRRGRDEHTTVECLLTASKPFGNKDKRNRWDKDTNDLGFNAAGSSKVNTEPRHVLLTLTSSVVPSSAPGQQSNGGLRALAPRDIVVIRPYDQVLEQCVDASTALPALPQLRDHGLPSALPMSSSPSSYYAQPQHQHSSSSSSSRPDVTPCFLGIVQDSARDMRDRNSHNNGNGNGASASSSVSSGPTDAVTIRIIMPSSAGYPVPEVGTPGAPSRWRLIQLGSMSTLLLQYNSVAAVAHTYFAGPVFAPSAASPTKLPPLGNSSDLLTAPPRPPAVPEQLYRALCKRYDPSQLRVIFSVACGGAYTVPIVKVNNDGHVTKAYASSSSSAAASSRGAISDSCEVTTVIGPPGTGKTRTVLGMISALRAVLEHAAETAASEGGAQQQQAAPRNVAKDAATGRHILKPTAVSHTAMGLSAAPAAAAAAASSRPSSQPASKAPSLAASPAKEVDAAPAAVVGVGAGSAVASSSAATTETKPAGGVVIVLDGDDDEDNGDDDKDGSAGAGAPTLEPASGSDAIDARASSDAATADVDASVEDIIKELSQKHADSVSGAAGVPVHGDAGEGKYKDVISIASDDDDAATVANAVDDDDDVVLVGSSQVARAPSAHVPAADAAGAGTAISDGGGVDHLDGEGNDDDDGDLIELDGSDAMEERRLKPAHVAASTGTGFLVKKLPPAIALSAAAVKSRVPAPATIANHDDDDDGDDAGADDDEDDTDDDDDGGGLFIADSASSVVAQKRKDKLDKEASDIAVAAGLVGKKRGRKGIAAGSSSKVPRLVTSSSAGSALTGLQTTRVVPTAAAKVPVGKPAASALSASAVATASSTPSAAVAPPRPPKHIRVLICAPSNAACDEICARLLDLPEEHSSGTHTRAGDGAAAGSSHHHQHNLHSGGLLDASGRPFIPTVVRAGVGGSSSTRPEVVSVALERHVQRRMAKLLLRLPPITASAAPHPTRSAKIAATRTSAALRLTVVRKEIAQTEAMFRAAAGQAAAASGHGATSTLLAAAGVASSSSSKPEAKAASTTAVPTLTKPVMDPGTASRLRHLRREERDLADVITALSSPPASLISPGVADALRIQAVCEVMDGADVICTTLAGCGQLPNAWSRAEAGWLQVLCDIPPGSTGRGDNDADIINSIPALKEAHDYPAAACALALRFDAIIVDEAGQAIEPEVLAPLRLAYMGHIGAVQASKGNVGPGSGGGALSTTSRHDGPSWCRRFVMVGDPLQLPATVMSRVASDAGLDVSLFERLSAAGIRPLLLRSQYRMHGAISAFASGHFYRGMVKDAAAIHARASSSSSASAEPLALLQHTSHVPVHVDTCLRPVLLIDVPFGHESQGGANTREGFGIASDPSYGNDAEAAVAVALAGHILKLIADAKAKAETAATAGNKGKGSGQRKQNAAGSNPQNSLPDGKTLVVTNKQTHVVGTGGNTIAAMAPATAAGASSSAFAVNVEAVADTMDISSNDDSDDDGDDGDAGSNMELEEEEEAVAAPVASSAPTSRLDRHASGAGAGLPQQRGGGPHRGLVGIISPYREQVKRIRAMLALHLDEAAMKQVVVSSVDSFQGQEMDHVIISCVRSAPTDAATSAASSSSAAGAGAPNTIGFLADKRRLNVAVTRARHTLAIVCNASHLSAHDRDWAALIQHARRHADLDALKAAAIGNQKAQTLGISVTLGQAIARPDRPVVSAALPAPAAKPAQLVPLAAVYSIPQHLPSSSSSSMHGKAKKHQHGPADCCSHLIAELQKVHKNQ